MEKPSTSKDPCAIDYVPPENLGITVMDDFGTTNEENIQRIEHVEMERNKELDLGERNSRDPFETSTAETTNTASQGAAVENAAAEKSNDVVEILEEPQSETILENVYYVKVQNIEITQPCMVCHGIKVVKYNCHYNGAKTYICCDDCLFQFQASNTNIQLHEYFTKFYSPVQIDGSYKYARQCKQCACYLKAATGILSWEAMDFCKESCLYRYQSQKKFQCCAECGNEVIYKQLGKYAVRFGKMVRQFCSGKCLEDRKRKIKICSYCQKSVPLPKTTVGNKYFCHDICKGRYEHLQLPKKPPFLINRLDACCFVCKSTKPIQMEFDYHRSPFYFCSINCVTIFKFVQNCDPPPKKCHNCSKFVLQQYMERYALHYDNFVHYFCSEICQYIYIITHRRVIACIWCKVKKYNFDMIQKNNYLESTIFICSLYCLNSLKKSVNSVVSKRKTCFNCGQEVGVYNIKLADGKLQSFCSNHCISLYQSQFVTAQTQIQPKRTRGRTRQILPDKPGPLPIITSVCSLAPTATKAKGAEITIKKLIVIMPSELPDVRNVCLQVGQITFDKETQDNVECDSQEVQTDIPENGPKIIPIPVPIYIPFPMFSFRAPFPIPVPFPVVIPCPILIPLSKHTSANIMKEIKKDQVKAPSDPFEAELLMMAEIIADEEKEVSAEVESADDDEDDAVERPEYSPEQADASTPFGEDMLQMALKMASDFEEPPVDLEGALAASTIAASQAHNIEAGNEEVSDLQNVPQKVSGRGRGRGRPRGTRQNPSRRGRRPANVSVPVAEQPTSPAEPMEPVEKPDANMCLKYTFGVNAWKQWVITKNTELERSSRKLKTFKTELLQLTSDELNYSLCLFVKEVRKPNGTEYAPDTIYYLCLGIQQYLYENGRIDNIFCDSYYEKFTDCLDEICQKFSNLYNDSHYIVTRVEEEHLWESKQLGAHSPHVLLSTLMFFNTKHFNLKNVDEHMQLSFSHIMKHWKRNPNQPFVVKQAPSRNVLLRFYPPQSSFESGNRKKKVYEQQENEENPLRCPVKLYEFYLSKCPESVKTRNDVFYLLPERSCVPDSPVWYSTTPLDKPALEKMLHRVKMVKEINVALLTN